MNIITSPPLNASDSSRAGSPWAAIAATPTMVITRAERLQTR